MRTFRPPRGGSLDRAAPGRSLEPVGSAVFAGMTRASCLAMAEDFYNL